MAGKSPGIERPSKEVAVSNVRSKKSKKAAANLPHLNSVPLSGGKNGSTATPTGVLKDEPTAIVHMNGSNESVSVKTKTKLPNQPLTPVVTEMPKSSELCSAAVKWKSKLTLLDADTKIKKSSGEFTLDKNEPPRDETPRPNHSSVTAPTDGDGAEASPTRKLSLGDFVTDESTTKNTQEPVVWNDMEGSSTGLVKALPYIPVSLAYTCLIFNIIIPGSGTIIAGMSMMCCGEPRGQVKPDEIFHQFTTNIFVGVSQFFTVTFFLAGWIWSITWGIYLVLFAEANKRRKAEEKKRNKTAVIANTLWNR